MAEADVQRGLQDLHTHTHTHAPSSPQLQPTLLPEQAVAARELKLFLRAVADPNRLAILRLLSQSDGLNVLDLADRLVLSQPLTSWHLHILKRARLVEPTHVGRRHFYRLNRERLREYKELFSSVLDL